MDCLTRPASHRSFEGVEDVVRGNMFYTVWSHRPLSLRSVRSHRCSLREVRLAAAFSRRTCKKGRGDGRGLECSIDIKETPSRCCGRKHRGFIEIARPGANKGQDRVHPERVADSALSYVCLPSFPGREIIRPRRGGTDAHQCVSGADPFGRGCREGPSDEPRGRAMWQMSDWEAVIFLGIVAATVALAVAVAWP